MYIIIILFITVVKANGIKEKVENEIQARFHNSNLVLSDYKIPLVIKTNIEKTVRQRFFKNKIFYWKIFNNKILKGIAILDNVYGKTMPITFLVIFDVNGNIISSSIIKYREAHGGEVGNKNWLIQFENKNAASSFVFGKDIDGISGATISAKSVTKGIKKLTLIAKIILGNK